MYLDTKRSSGKNNFINSTFSAREWSADLLKDPAVIRGKLDDFALEGRKIKALRFIGMDYAHSRDTLEEIAYNQLDEYEEEERQTRSEYENIDPMTKCIRYAEIDEPLLIEFEDEDVFEIDTPQAPVFRFSMNTIPWHIGVGKNLQNVDAEILFSSCIGKTIREASVETYMADRDPMYGTHFKREIELVSAVLLKFCDGSYLRIWPQYDFCNVALYVREGELDEITFGELKAGLFNWEDLHIDLITGFRAVSGHLFFNSTGRKYIGNPHRVLSCEDCRYLAYIRYDEILPLDLAATCFLNEYCDENDDYDFTADQWHEILDRADRILRYDSFDDLFDDLTGYDMDMSTRRWNL